MSDGATSRQPKPCIACRQRPAAWTSTACRLLLPMPARRPIPATSVHTLQRRQDGDGPSGGTILGVEYYSQGMCTRCHPAAPQRLESCRDCLRLGRDPQAQVAVLALPQLARPAPHGNLPDLSPCRPRGQPRPGLQPLRPADEHHPGRHARGSQRRRAAALLRQHALAAHQDPLGQRPPGRQAQSPQPRTGDRADSLSPSSSTRSNRSSSTLFDMPRDLNWWPAPRTEGCSTRDRLPDPPHEQMAAFLDAAVLDHARRHGWPKSTIHRTHARCASCSSCKTPPARCCWPATPSAPRDRADRASRHRRRHRRRRHAR